MSLLAACCAPFLALLLQHSPVAPEPAAQVGHDAQTEQAAVHAPGDLQHEEAGGHEAAGHEELTPSVIFEGLFKHLEPHAVAGVWFGGSKGFGFVAPYESDSTGEPTHRDAHGEPEVFHDRDTFNTHYRAEFGSGQGLLIYNINTAQWIAALALTVLVIIGARSARRQTGQTPRGSGYHILESIVLYVRDDMVYPVMGKHHGDPFVPLFLTQFFFILFMNIFGLVPFGMFGLGHLGATATANLAVTGGMALTTLLFIHFSGMREHGFFHHWKNFLPPGLPWFVLPIIVPVEIMGMLVKPAALTIRLFANMVAGHLVVLSFFGLIYMFGSYLVGVPVLGMSIAIYCLELFVCFVQAYIFTYLSIIFVGASVHPEH